MTITAVEITKRPPPSEPASPQVDRTAEPTGVVVVSNVEALTATNQRGCGNDNPYN